MCETKAVLVSFPLFLLVVASFCVYYAYTENEVGHHSKIKSQSPCENGYEKFCLNCLFKGYYLIHEDSVGCNCTWLCGVKGCEKYNYRDWVTF